MAQTPFVLVTGGTGYLGSHIVAQLLDAGYKVRCTARTLKARFLAEAHLARGSQFEVVEVEDLATADLSDTLTDIQAVIHSAFPAPGSMESTELLINGVSSTTNLLRQAYECGIHKFVVTSSYLAVIGERPESVWSNHTFTDRDWGTATYDAVFDGTQDPARVYAAAKKLAEAAAWDFAQSRPSIDLASVIPTLLIGPFAPGHAVLSTGDLSTNILLQSLITLPKPPHPVWPYFVDVRDAATAHIQALEAPALLPPARPTPRALTPLSGLESAATDSPLPMCESPSTPSLLSITNLLAPTPSPSPTTPTMASSDEGDGDNNDPTTTTTASPPPRKRLIASGASFTWAEAISHLRTARPDLAQAGRLPDEKTCISLPEQVARLDTRWSGAAAAAGGQLSMEEEPVRDGDAVWTGIEVRWRDWRETVEEAVRDLEMAAARLEQSGWEELFEEDSESTDRGEDGGAGGG